MKLAEPSAQQTQSHIRFRHLIGGSRSEMREKWAIRNRHKKKQRPSIHSFEICFRSVSSAQTQHQMQRRLLLNIIIRQRTPILELFARENQSLLLGRNSLLILNLRLHILNR